MALFGVTIADSDLEAVFPDLDNYQFSEQTDFSSARGQSEREIYREIKQKIAVHYPFSSDENLEEKLSLVKDLGSQNIKDKWVYLALAHIFVINGRLDLAETYRLMSSEIALDFYIDEDEDSTVDESERKTLPKVRFGR